MGGAAVGKGRSQLAGTKFSRKWLVSKGHSFHGNVSVPQLVMEAQRMFAPGTEMEKDEILGTLNNLLTSLLK